MNKSVIVSNVNVIIFFVIQCLGIVFLGWDYKNVLTLYAINIFILGISTVIQLFIPPKNSKKLITSFIVGTLYSVLFILGYGIIGGIAALVIISAANQTIFHSMSDLTNILMESSLLPGILAISILEGSQLFKSIYKIINKKLSREEILKKPLKELGSIYILVVLFMTITKTFLGNDYKADAQTAVILAFIFISLKTISDVLLNLINMQKKLVH